ncbi:MAG: class I SAM-dependent methyltransferase [Armatimonadota bacterium]
MAPHSSRHTRIVDHRSERAFHDAIARRRIGEQSDADLRLPALRHLNYGIQWIAAAVSECRGASVLDCGCGDGTLSCILASRGARVYGLDISSESLLLARRMAAANGVAERTRFVHGVIERLPFSDESFDIVVGAFILHHAPIEDAAPEIARVLRPNGKAVFSETWSKNPLLMFARKHLAGRAGIPRYGTARERPLGDSDIRHLQSHFADVRVEVPSILFVRKAIRLFLWTGRLAAPIWEFLQTADRALHFLCPPLRRYSYVVRLTCTK